MALDDEELQARLKRLADDVEFSRQSPPTTPSSRQPNAAKASAQQGWLQRLRYTACLPLAILTLPWAQEIIATKTRVRAPHQAAKVAPRPFL